MVLGVAVLVGTLVWCGRRRDRIDPAGTAPFAVLAAGLLCSPISWHNYLMLLWPGVLMLITLGRGAAAAVALAVAVIPVSWNADWPPEGLVADLGRSLYCVILLGYWVALLLVGPALADVGRAGCRRPRCRLSMTRQAGCRRRRRAGCRRPRRG